MDLAGLTADRTNTYNVWTTQTELWKKSLESAEMGEDTQKQLKAFQEGESTQRMRVTQKQYKHPNCFGTSAYRSYRT